MSSVSLVVEPFSKHKGHKGTQRISAPQEESAFRNPKSAIAIGLHILIVRAVASFGSDPVDDLIGVHDVAGFAVNAVGKIDLQLHLTALFANNLIDRGWTKMLARITEFVGAAVITDIQIPDVQVAGLIFIMRGSGMVDVGHFVECEDIVKFKDLGGNPPLPHFSGSAF